MSPTVLSIVPYISIIDVTIELPLISGTATLCFGPFHSLQQAEEWSVEVERLHMIIEKREEELSGVIFDETGLSTGVFVRSYINVPDVALASMEARKPGAVIPADDPEIVARDMHIYALRAFESAVAMTLQKLT